MPIKFPTKPGLLARQQLSLERLRKMRIDRDPEMQLIISDFVSELKADLAAHNIDIEIVAREHDDDA
ncbi:hypothetical protein [Pararhizobium qamdonense]|uniref:hypothetical protein n=1 Tax=Pararhizobium qamdonense TaxID=3031126 RepID=UPI0023E1AE25|nr:hypothetical protein [Pararhizobium qamdonense]